MTICNLHLKKLLNFVHKGLLYKQGMPNKNFLFYENRKVFVN